MISLSDEERERVVKLAGMLGSSFDGERANAAHMLAKMAIGYKLTINELLALAYKPKPEPVQSRPTTTPNWNTYVDEEFNVVQKLREIDGHPCLNSWERNFVSDVPEKYEIYGELTERQREWAEKIITKVRRAAQ